jgi:YbbR domain-containing protein
VIGLMPGLVSQVAPATVDVILAGPVPDLENLSPVDVRVVVDLAGLTPGTYQLTPQVSILPERIQLQAISPVTIEVTIADSPTPTETPEGAGTPIATPKP